MKQNPQTRDRLRWLMLVPVCLLAMYADLIAAGALPPPPIGDWLRGQRSAQMGSQTPQIARTDEPTAAINKNDERQSQTVKPPEVPNASDTPKTGATPSPVGPDASAARESETAKAEEQPSPVETGKVEVAPSQPETGKTGVAPSGPEIGKTEIAPNQPDAVANAAATNLTNAAKREDAVIGPPPTTATTRSEQSATIKSEITPTPSEERKNAEMRSPPQAPAAQRRKVASSPLSPFGDGMTWGSNQIISGTAYLAFPTSTREQCAAHCRRDARCNAVEFVKETDTCRLYKEINNSTPNDISDDAFRDE